MYMYNSGSTTPLFRLVLTVDLSLVQILVTGQFNVLLCTA